MRTILFALLFAASSAWAGSAAMAVSGSSSLSSSGATSSAATTATQAATQAANQALTTSQGNDQSINITSPGTIDYTGSYTVKSVPGINMGNVFPTSPCMGASSIGAAGVGFGISVGSSWTDHECGKRETARSFAAIGLTNDALKILCSSEYSAAAPSCVSVTPLPAQLPTQGPVRDCQPDPYIAQRTGKAACK